MLHHDMKLFGSVVRTKILVAIARLGETYPEELATLLGYARPSVARIVAALEADGVVATAPFGRERRVRLNERFIGAEPLYRLLLVLAKYDEDVLAAVMTVRRRPRRRALAP